MTAPWQPFREPLRRTLLRTGAIALVAGAAIAWSMGGLRWWPLATVLVLWFSFGGHWVEVLFLNWVRPRLSPESRLQIAARVAVWFVGGVALAFGGVLTATIVAGHTPTKWPAWWFAGVAFIVLELLVHLRPQWRGQPSFYNGRG